MMMELTKSLRDHELKNTDLRKDITWLIDRSSDLTDMYLCALDVYEEKKKIPAAIKRGIADGFNKLSIKQLSKHHDVGMSLKELLQIVHPAPADLEKAEIFNKIVACEIPTTPTAILMLDALQDRPVTASKAI